MKNNIFALALALAVAAGGCTDDPVALPTGTGEKGFNIDPRTDELWTQVNESADGFDTSYYFDFILSASHYGMDQKYIRVALQRFLDLQIKEGPDMGKVPRNVGGDYSDVNNIEFALELACPALIEYYKDWSDENKALFDDFVDKALCASWKHDNVSVTYTNIYVMRVWNMIALGENLDPNRTWGGPLNLTTTQIAKKGYDMLAVLLEQTRKWGIHEHNSPTYTGVQMENIGYLVKYTKNPGAKADAEMLKNYLSAAVFANYFAPAKMLTGPMSRCYYRGSSGGKIDQLAGGLIYGYNMYHYNELAVWEPSAEDREINNTYPRLISYTFGPEMQKDSQGRDVYSMNAMNYIDRKFSISSAGHHYTGNGTEKAMTIVVSGDANRSIINFCHYLEARNDPFGRINYGSHTWTGFRDAYARSQHENEFVALQASNGRDNPPSPSNLMSHILVPGTYVDEMWVGNERIYDWFAMSGNAKVLSTSSGLTYFARIEDIVVSVRYLFTFGTDGKAKQPVLIYDTSANCSYVYGTALRLTTALKDTVPVQDDLGGVVMWWRVDKDIRTDEQFAALRNKVINAEVHAPMQKVYTEGDEMECYVTTPEGLKLGIKGKFAKAKHYNRWIMSDAEPEYTKEAYWCFEQSDAYGSSIDFSDRSQAYFSINGKDVGLSLTNQ